MTSYLRVSSSRFLSSWELASLFGDVSMKFEQPIHLGLILNPLVLRKANSL